MDMVPVAGDRRRHRLGHELPRRADAVSPARGAAHSRAARAGRVPRRACSADILRNLIRNVVETLV